MTPNPVDDDPGELTIWQIVRWRMNAHRVTPRQLAEYAEYPISRIEEGLRRNPIKITDTFLRNLVALLGLTSGRNEIGQNASETLTRRECIDLLKPPKAMPPPEVNFWENPDILNDD